jgi:signal transduction histidine kinase
VKSLFLRLLVSLWLTMTVLVCLFALIHAWAFASQPDAVRRRLGARGAELRAENALHCAKAGMGDCERPLAPIDPRDQRVAIYKSGEIVMGQPIEGAADMEEAARRVEEGIASRVADKELTAVVLPRDKAYVAVTTGPVRSPWMFFIVPETLPYRLLAITAVTGLVSVLLARYLSRPIGVLRAATQQIAGGDLSARVAPRLKSADSETLALGRDMDRMAERIQELLESQRRLLRDVSHELRSPLARLNIALELVRRKSSPDLEPAFDRIERETERLNAMIGELLTLSRLESGEALLPKEKQRIDLAALVAEIVDDVGLEASPGGSRVALDAGAGFSLEGSQELLRRAIENVLRNAVRFTEPGSTVSVRIQRAREGVERAREGAEGAFAEIRVRDHGPGVPEAALEDIFKPFYRVGDDRARGSGGTGIGLAITRRAVLLHGGEVRAENVKDAEGSGLLVTLRLPIQKDGIASA